MTAKQLIGILQKFPDDTEVRLNTSTSPQTSIYDYPAHSVYVRGDGSIAVTDRNFDRPANVILPEEAAFWTSEAESTGAKS